MCFFLFFFKQKTAYEMRISDWSSDVCSSDLATHGSEGGSRQRVGRRSEDRSGSDLARDRSDGGRGHARFIGVEWLLCSKAPLFGSALDRALQPIHASLSFIISSCAAAGCYSLNASGAMSSGI